MMVIFRDRASKNHENFTSYLFKYTGSHIPGPAFLGAMEVQMTLNHAFDNPPFAINILSSTSLEYLPPWIGFRNSKPHFF